MGMVGLLIGVVCSAAPHAVAQDRTVFSDWVLECDARAPQGACFVSQSLSLKDSGTRLFQIAAGEPFGDGQQMLLVTGPLGMYLPSGIRFSVDNAKWSTVALRYCNNDGCHGFHPLDQALVDELKRGRWLNVSIRDGSRQEVRFKASLNGFTAAFSRLSRKP
jgi:invasion protein IalB